MFSKKIIDTDLFLDMPTSTRLLYYDLSMRADDDGFVSSPKKITHMIGCSDDDLKLLIAKQFIIPFESGICVIKDWKIHNYIQKDRYHETQYTEEKKQLIEKNGVYTKCIQDVSSLLPEVRLGKVRLEQELGKVKKEKDISEKFTIPTVEEVKIYCIERNNNIDAEYFVHFYQTRGWILSNGKKMHDWKSAVITWEKRNKEKEVKSAYKDL
jgi:hypothetical protein